jgi:hypothetical protein
MTKWKWKKKKVPNIDTDSCTCFVSFFYIIINAHVLYSGSSLIINIKSCISYAIVILLGS